MKDAYESMMDHHKFMLGFPISPSTYQNYFNDLNKGYAYIYRRDRHFRPVFYININKLKKIKSDPETLIAISSFIIQFVITRALVPGKIENWVTVIDFKGVGLTEIPKKLITSMTKPL